MNKSFKHFKMQFFVACCLLSSTNSASFFGVDLKAPSKVVKTGIGEVSQVFKRSKPQYPNFSSGGNIQFPNDNDDSGTTGDSYNGYNLPPAGTLDSIEPQQPSKIDQNQDNNQFSDSSLPNKYGSDTYDSEKIQGNTLVKYDSEYSDTDYITESTDSETTTTDSLNRVGGAPPAVVASLLG